MSYLGQWTPPFTLPQQGGGGTEWSDVAAAGLDWARCEVRGDCGQASPTVPGVYTTGTLVPPGGSPRPASFPGSGSPILGFLVAGGLVAAALVAGRD